MSRRFTPWEITFIREVYPHVYTYDIAAYLDRTCMSIHGKAYGLGITKSPEWRQIELARQGDRMAKANYNTRFKKGHAPANKGHKVPDHIKEKIKHTFFHKGNVPHNVKYDGHERIDKKDGYILMRIQKGKYVLKHRHIWEAHYGSIPRDMIITFKDGDRLNTDITNLKMITRREGIALNSIARYPELRTNILLIAKLKKLINEKQN